MAALLNVTFGNAPELIISFFALLDGLQEVVKASLVGSVIGNCLLVLGAAMLAGGRNRTRQTFDRTAAQTNSGLLLVTVVALVLPTVLVLARGDALPTVGEHAPVLRRPRRAPLDRGQPRDDRDLRLRTAVLSADASRLVHVRARGREAREARGRSAGR